MIFLRGFIVSACCFFLGIEITNVYFLPVQFCARRPFPTTFMPVNSFESALIFPILGSIGIILRAVADAKICSPTIQCVPIFMIYFSLIFLSQTKNKTVHENAFTVFSTSPLRACCVKTFRKLIPVGKPVPSRQPLIVRSIDNRILILRKWDIPVRCVRRLSDNVAFYPTFHGGTSI